MKVFFLLGAALALSAATLGGCGSVAKRPTTELSAPPAQVKALRLSGRLSVRQGKEAQTGTVRWLHDTPHHEIAVFSPIGTTLATLVQDSDKVKLTTSDKETYEATDAESLMDSVLGWRLPISGMQYWVLGKAAPPEREAVLEMGADHRLSRLTQKDWKIEYTNYRPVGNTELPGRIIMRRDDVEVKFFVDSIVQVESRN